MHYLASELTLGREVPASPDLCTPHPQSVQRPHSSHQFHYQPQTCAPATEEEKVKLSTT